MPKELEMVRSCGVLVFRHRGPHKEFLLMKHKTRWDLPKGHVDPGETDIECALRELWEETGIPSDAIQLAADFQFSHQYEVKSHRVKNGREMKTLVIFMGELLRDIKIKPTEHPDFAWMLWSPPHQIQTQTIDALLSAVDEYNTRSQSA